MKCYQCSNAAMFVIEADGVEIPLCLNCNLKLVRLQNMQNAEHERLINFMIDQMDSSVGLPGVTPKFPERRTIHGGNVAFNNIKISDSTIGVLNTGNIDTVDSAVTVIRQSEPQLSEAILNLTQAIVADHTIASDRKNKIIEVLSFIATEATAPKGKRRSFGVRFYKNWLHFSGVKLV